MLGIVSLTLRNVGYQHYASTPPPPPPLLWNFVLVSVHTACIHLPCFTSGMAASSATCACTGHSANQTFLGCMHTMHFHFAVLAWYCHQIPRLGLGPLAYKPSQPISPPVSTERYEMLMCNVVPEGVAHSKVHSSGKLRMPRSSSPQSVFRDLLMCTACHCMYLGLLKEHYYTQVLRSYS